MISLDRINLLILKPTQPKFRPQFPHFDKEIHECTVHKDVS